MSFVSYPDAAAVENLIRSAGYWPTDATKQELAAVQAEIGAEAAKDEWEHLTGWLPFLAKIGATERVFNASAPTGFVDFHGGAVSVENVAIGSRVLGAGVDYWTYPRNALSQGEPITGLEVRGGGVFNSSSLSRGQIKITGRWGCRAEVPGDVYQAILQKAALVVLTQIENLQSIASISQDGFSKAYDVVGIVSQHDLVVGGVGGGGVWGANFKSIAARYRRGIC